MLLNGVGGSNLINSDEASDRRAAEPQHGSIVPDGARSFYSTSATKRVHILFRKLFGREIAENLLQYTGHGLKVPGLVFSIILSTAVKKIFLAFFAAALTWLGIPIALVIFYSMSNGLPVFEVLETVGTNAGTLTLVTAVLTTLLAAVFLFPGWVWSHDPPLRNLKWFNPTEMGNEFYWTRLRWCFSFLPGVMVVALFSLIYGLLSDKPKDLVNASILAGSFFLAGIAYYLIGYFSFKRGSMHFGKYKSHPKFLRWRHVFREPGWPVLTNLLSLFFVAVYMQIIGSGIEKYKIFEPYLDKNGIPYTAAVCLTVSFMSLSFLAMTTMWAVGRKAWTPIVMVAIGIIFVAFIHPGLSTLMRNYMSAMRVGGGAPVIIAIDRKTSKTWPEFFHAEISDDSLDYIQSKPLSLLLMGRQRIFLSALSPNPSNAQHGVLMVDRSKVQEIMFISKQ